MIAPPAAKVGNAVAPVPGTGMEVDVGSGRMGATVMPGIGVVPTGTTGCTGVGVPSPCSSRVEIGMGTLGVRVGTVCLFGFWSGVAHTARAEIKPAKITMPITMYREFTANLRHSSDGIAKLAARASLRRSTGAQD